MNIIRRYVDEQAVASRDDIFAQFPDGEDAHHWATQRARLLNALGLTRFVLRGEERNQRTTITFANAAGSNKHGLIPTNVLYNIGFDENIIGTITYQPWEGNKPTPRIERLLDQESLRNWLGLPGPGAEAVARNVENEWNRPNYTDCKRVVSLMSTPAPTMSAEEKVYDVGRTARRFKGLVDSFELNISCPNTHSDRDENVVLLEGLLGELSWVPRLRIKLSPDAPAGYGAILAVASHHPNVTGFVGFNTTRDYAAVGLGDKGYDKGGISGKILYPLALQRQRELVAEIDRGYSQKDWRLHVVGGIDSPETLLERIAAGDGRVAGAQLFTGLIYKGPGLLTQLRKAAAE